MPFYGELHRRYHDQGLEVVAISVDEDEAAARRFFDGLSLPFALLWDSDHAVVGRWDIDTMPTSFLIDRQGVVRHAHPGFTDATRARTEAQLQVLLK